MSDVLKITVHLTPNARQNAVLGWGKDADGRRVLKVQVTAIPEKGKANQALVKLLSKAWKIPKSSIEIMQGETSRVKVLQISAEIDEEIMSASFRK